MAAEHTASRRLPLMVFEIACEAIEKKLSDAFKAAQKAAKDGDLPEVERLEAVCDGYATKLEALIEGQLAAAGQARPAAPTLAA